MSTKQLIVKASKNKNLLNINALDLVSSKTITRVVSNNKFTDKKDLVLWLLQQLDATPTTEASSKQGVLSVTYHTKIEPIDNTVAYVIDELTNEPLPKLLTETLPEIQARFTDPLLKELAQAVYFLNKLQGIE